VVLAISVLLVLAASCASGGDDAATGDLPFLGGTIRLPDLSQPFGAPASSESVGDDEAQDALALACEDGDLRSCDDLFQRGAPASPYAAYAFSCGGRLTPPPPTGVAANCRLRGSGHLASAGGTLPSGDSPTLDRIAQQCGRVGGVEACDTLFRLAPQGTEYASYGITCGYRSADTRPNACAGFDGVPEGRPPEGVSGDPELDVQARECFASRLSSCDELYASSDRGTTYELYAQSCGGRLAEVVEEVQPSCDLRFNDPVASEPVAPPAEPLGDSDRLDALVERCADGDLRACDELFYRSELNTDYENWGATCGGRFAARRAGLEFSAAGECEARVAVLDDEGQAIA